MKTDKPPMSFGSRERSNFISLLNYFDEYTLRESECRHDDVELRIHFLKGNVVSRSYVVDVHYDPTTGVATLRRGRGAGSFIKLDVETAHCDDQLKKRLGKFLAKHLKSAQILEKHLDDFSEQEAERIRRTNEFMESSPVPLGAYNPNEEDGEMVVEGFKDKSKYRLRVERKTHAIEFQTFQCSPEQAREILKILAPVKGKK